MVIHKSNSNNDFLNDSNLSLKAKGVLSYLKTLPQEFSVSELALTGASTDGKESTRGAVKELERKGYLKRVEIRNEEGQFERIDWFI